MEEKIKMVNIKLNEEEYDLLKECLKWNLYSYKSKLGLPLEDFQKEQIKKMEELNSRIKKQNI